MKEFKMVVSMNTCFVAQWVFLLLNNLMVVKMAWWVLWFPFLSSLLIMIVGVVVEWKISKN